MSKKGKIYLAIGIVLAMIQIMWIVPEIRTTMASAWKIILYIVLTAVGLFIPIFSAIKLVNWYIADGWYVKLGICAPSSILVAGVNTGLAHLMFLLTSPGTLESDATTIVFWVTFTVFIIAFLITWYYVT